jgi:hypothetical protein
MTRSIKRSPNARRCGNVAWSSPARTGAQNTSIEVASACRSRGWRARASTDLPLLRHEALRAPLQLPALAAERGEEHAPCEIGREEPLLLPLAVAGTVSGKTWARMPWITSPTRR